MEMAQKHVVLAVGGVAAGLLVGWWMWKQPAPDVASRVSALVTTASQIPPAPQVQAPPGAPVTPAPGGQALPTADPAFWGAWFRGHVGDEALRRAQALMAVYGHHRAMIMIMEAIGTSLYGQGARW